jgi:hypothetical protein
MKRFFTEIFQDDVKEFCVGRFSLVLGMLLTVVTGVWSIDTVGDITMWEAIVRCSPGLIGLIAYIFTRLAEMKEWLAETAEKVVKKK